MGRFKVLVVKSINITIICDVVLCSLADIYHHFKGLYCLRLEGTLKKEAVNSSKMLVYLHLTRRCHVADENDDGNDDDDDDDDHNNDDNKNKNKDNNNNSLYSLKSFIYQQMHFISVSENIKIYMKIYIKIVPTCFVLRPSSGSLHMSLAKDTLIKSVKVRRCGL
jgi:hypothetical protein